MGRKKLPVGLSKKSICMRAYPEDIKWVEKDFGSIQKFWNFAVNHHKAAVMDKALLKLQLAGLLRSQEKANAKLKKELAKTSRLKK